MEVRIFPYSVYKTCTIDVVILDVLHHSLDLHLCWQPYLPVLVNALSDREFKKFDPWVSRTNPRPKQKGVNLTYMRTYVHTTYIRTYMLQKHVQAWTGRVSRQLSTMASSAAATSNTPMEDAIRTKITEALMPSRLEIFNDSSKHAHHRPMVGSTSKETHFRLVITSDAFKSKMQPARHRIIYQLLKDEMAQDGGIHALQLRTMTPEEEQRLNEREQLKQGSTTAAEAS
ncbi:bola protein [Hypoxylon sp. NC1633]|nr:bola protein [Hypoxylon sp. NC1633]